MSKKESLEYWAKETPDTPAIVDGDRELTYGEWNRLSNKLASAFNAIGLGRDDKVAVRMHTRWEWNVINQALAKIGARQIAVNWKLTPPESRYIVEDSGAVAVIFDDDPPEDLLEHWQSLPMKMFLSVSPVSASNCLYLHDVIEKANDEEFVASGPVRMVYYTSGTTGKPKGALLSDKTIKTKLKEILEYIEDMASNAPISPNRRVLMAMPMHHGAGPLASNNGMRAGGTLYQMGKYDAEKALQIIHDHKINIWPCVPTMLNRVQALGEKRLAQYDVSSMELISIGAAAVPFSLKKFIIDYFGQHCLYENYGVTETGMLTRISPADQLRKPGSSGKPFKHVHISIRDEQGKELPTNEEGEIYVKSPLMIDEYIGKGPLGKDSLSEDGYFRVGDVGYLDDEGYLFITDRIKDMIVAGGVNIYPAEIEEVLIQHPDIIDVAVIGIPQEDFGEQVMAFCEVGPDVKPDEKEILEFCKDKLAKYKLPRKFEFMAELPRNPMGKVLKIELRKPFWEGRERKI